MSAATPKKSKVDPEEEEEDEVAEIDVDKEGQLSLLGTKKWHSYFFIISGPNLLYKKSEKDPEVKAVIKLVGATIGPKSDPKKEHAFEIKPTEGNAVVMAASTADAAKEWLEVLKEHSKEAKKDAGKKKQSRLMALKKNVAGKVATSSAGKGVLKDMIGTEGVALINHIKEVIRMVDGKKKATEIENNILKLGVKIILLYRNKDISLEELSKPRIQIKQLWSDVLDMLEVSFCYDLKRLQSQTQKLSDDFEGILKSYISDKNLVMIRDTMAYVGSDAILNKLYTADECEKLRPELQKILRALWDRVYNPKSTTPAKK